MKIYTCAFKPFEADEAFFKRDSGLLCRTFQSMGIDSKVIMPSRDGEDPDDVIRVAKTEFFDPSWWKSLGIDAVIFIAWGFKQHTPVINAARDAGIRTCALFDCNGDPFPYGSFLSKPVILWRKSKFIEKLPMRIIGTVLRVLLCAFKGFQNHYFRSVQIGVPHIAGFQTPSTMNRCLRVAAMFPWIIQQSNTQVIGYAIPETPAVTSSFKRRQNIVAVARWDALRHKRPHMLMHVIDEVLKTHPTVTFEIYGRLIPDMELWHSKLAQSAQERVMIHGVQASSVVMNSICSSQILYCPSVEEGVPLPVIEALCCGCSVVGLGTPAVPGLYWGIAEGHGTSALDDKVKSHSQALITELGLWERNQRDPLKIASFWSNWFSSRSVATRIKELLSPKI